MLSDPHECRLGWWLFFVAINCYYISFVVAQTTIHPRSLQVFVGDNAIFECNTKELLSSYNWEWFYGNKVPIMLGNVSLDGYEFKITDGGQNSRITILNTTIEDDQTQYYCRYGSISNIANLTVIAGTRLDPSYPQCEADITAVNTMKTVNMTCRAYGGLPRPSLQWYRNGEKLMERNDSLSSFVGDISYFDEFTRVLTVDDETAIYTCRAEGLAVKGNQNCSISLATPPTVTIIATTTYFTVGDSLEFTCMAMGPWNITDYIWTFDNKLVMSPNSTFIISNLQSKDAGKEIGCNALTASGLNGNDSVMISFFNEDQESNTFQLIPIVVGGVIALTLVCITVFLIIRQMRKRKRALSDKAVSFVKNDIVHGVPLDNPNICISEENSDYHGNGNYFPPPENTAPCRHNDECLGVNDQENVRGGRASIRFPIYVNTASLDSYGSTDALELDRLDSDPQEHISHKCNHTEDEGNLGFDDMYAQPFKGTQKTDTKSNNGPTDFGDLYAKPIKGTQNPDTRSVDGIVDFGDLYAKPIKGTHNPDARSVDGIVDVGDLYAKPIKHRKSIHQSIEDITGTMENDSSPKRSGSVDILYSQPNKNRLNAHPVQFTELYAQPNKEHKEEFKPRSITYNAAPNRDVNSLPQISNDQSAQNLSNLIQEDFTYSSIA